jgi:hypothetical protein
MILAVHENIIHIKQNATIGGFNNGSHKIRFGILADTGKTGVG